MKKYLIGIFLILIFLYPRISTAQNWASFTADDQYWWQDGTGDIYTLDRSVGINKDSPDYELDVSGDIHATGSVILDGGIGTTGDISTDGTLYVDDITNYSGNTVAFDTDVLVVDTSGGQVGIGETSPDTLFHMTSTTPYQKFLNTSEEDTNGGRESKIIFSGEASGGEEADLVWIEASHDGTDDDQQGKLIIYTNDASNDTPTAAVTIDSDQAVTFAGNTYLGAIQLPEDGGEVTGINMDINDATVDSVHSFSFDLDGEPLLTAAGDSSGDTQIKDKRLEVGDDVEVIMSVSSAFRGIRKTIRTVTANYTMTASDDVVICNGAAITITLPTASSVSDITGNLTKSPEWRVFNAHANDVTVDAWTTAATTINDSSTDTISQYNGLTVATDGAEYWEIP